LDRAHFGVGITEIDDFQILLGKMTTPAQYPALHFFPNAPGARDLGSRKIFRRGLGIGPELEPGIEAVVKTTLPSIHRLCSKETSFTPDSCLGFSATHQRAESEGSLSMNRTKLRSWRTSFGENRRLDARRSARVSWLYASWLRNEALRAGVRVVSSRPWRTAFERVLEALA
jgi:hypothetical protein